MHKLTEEDNTAPRCLGNNNGPISNNYVTRQPKINLTSDHHQNSHDNIVAKTLLSDKMSMTKYRIRIIKIIVQLAMDQHGTKVPTKTEHD